MVTIFLSRHKRYKAGRVCHEWSVTLGENCEGEKIISKGTLMNPLRGTNKDMNYQIMEAKGPLHMK